MTNIPVWMWSILLQTVVQFTILYAVYTQVGFTRLAHLLNECHKRDPAHALRV